MWKNGVFVCVVLGAAACATTSEESDAPEACIIIDNREGGGSIGLVYLVEGRSSMNLDGLSANEIIEGRGRVRVGQVTMGREVRECIRRDPLEGNYFLVAEGSVDRMDPADTRNGRFENQPPALFSEDFFLRAGETVRWEVRLNRISLMTQGGG